MSSTRDIGRLAAWVGRPMRFVIAGGVSTGVYFLLLILLRDHVSPTALLVAVCYLAGMMVNFFAQALFTFRSHSIGGAMAFRYSIVQGSALAVNSGAMALLVDILKWALVPSQVMVTGVISVGVYLVSKGWVYR